MGLYEPKKNNVAKVCITKYDVLNLLKQRSFISSQCSTNAKLEILITHLHTFRL